MTNLTIDLTTEKNPIQGTSSNGTEQKGKLRSRELKPYQPASHGTTRDSKYLKIVSIVVLGLFLISCVFWGVGEAKQIANLKLTGEIMFGGSLAGCLGLLSVVVLAMCGCKCDGKKSASYTNTNV